MCGLIFIHRADEKPAQKMVTRRYHKQKSRGISGFGFISFDKAGSLKTWQRSENESDILGALAKNQEPNIIFHHRQPTSTPNLVESTHPIKVSNELLDHDYYVIHNGIITNDVELKAQHEKLGFTYQTEMKKKYITNERVYSNSMFNDSEALAIELALAIEDLNKSKIPTKGSIAFVALQVDKINQKVLAIYFGRNYSNPLLLDEKEEFFTLTSEGEGEIVPANLLHKFDMGTKEFTNRILEIGETPYSYDRHGYSGSYLPTTEKEPADHKEFYQNMGYDMTESGILTPRKLLPKMESDTDRELYSYMIENDLIDDEDGFKYEPEDILVDLYQELDTIKAEINRNESTMNEEFMDDLMDRYTEVLAHIKQLETALDMKDVENEALDSIRADVVARRADLELVGDKYDND